MKKITHTVVSLLLLGPTFASANDISFSIGGGYPYFVIPEVSVASADLSQRWYGNYKIGLDDGFAVGFEQAISDVNRMITTFNPNKGTLDKKDVGLKRSIDFLMWLFIKQVTKFLIPDLWS